MTFDWLLRDSGALTALFIVLTIIAVFTQFTKTTKSKSIPVPVRALIKAAPALFLSGLGWYLGYPLIGLAFLLCGIGDILLDLPEETNPLAFEIGAVSFALALICFSVASLQKPLPGHALWPLSITNIVIAIFVLRWVLPLLKGKQLILELSYFAMLIISNVIASTSTLPVFLGSSLWFMSDLSIGLGSKVSDDPANSLDTLGLYAAGLYFLALGFLNS